MGAIFTRIRVRILAIVLLAIIPAIGLIYYSAAERKRQISEDIESNALRLSRFLASNLERDLLQGQGFLESVAINLESSSFKPAIGRGLFSRMLGDSSVYSNIGVADASGKVLCSAAPIPADSGLGKLEWFNKAAMPGSLAVGFDFNGVLSDQASINLGMTLSNPSRGQAGWVVFAVMNLDWLDRLAEEAHLPAGSAVSVTNRKGDAVARYPDPDKWVGKPYPQDILANQWMTEHEGVKFSKGIDGIERLYAFSAVPGKGNFVVRIGIRREEAYVPANQALIQQLVALGLVSLLAILAAWFGADVFLLKQVNTLIEATRRLAAGNLAARSSLSYDKGELGDLAHAFDEMAEKLEWREAQLRESEIERANPINQIGEVLEIAPDATVLLDESFTIEAANRVAREIFGYESGELPGLPFDSICPDATSMKIELQPAREGDQPVSSMRLRTTGRRKDGKRFPIEASLSKGSLSRKTVHMAIFRLPQEKLMDARGGEGQA